MVVLWLFFKFFFFAAFSWVNNCFILKLEIVFSQTYLVSVVNLSLCLIKCFLLYQVIQQLSFPKGQPAPSCHLSFFSNLHWLLSRSPVHPSTQDASLSPPRVEALVSLFPVFFFGYFLILQQRSLQYFSGKDAQRDTFWVLLKTSICYLYK